MIQTLIMILIVAAAVWYLYRRFSATLRSENASRGCGGCDGCPAGPATISEKTECSRPGHEEENDKTR
jgi:hypothetical protein